MQNTRKILYFCLVDFASCDAYRFRTMFDEELPKPKTNEFPRNLENMSVSELADYVAELTEEIQRVQEDMAKKKASQEAADSVFK